MPPSFTSVLSPYSDTMGSICGLELCSLGVGMRQTPKEIEMEMCRRSLTTHKLFKEVAFGEQTVFTAACFRNLLHRKHVEGIFYLLVFDFIRYITYFFIFSDFSYFHCCLYLGGNPKVGRKTLQVSIYKYLIVPWDNTQSTISIQSTYR